MSRRVLNSRPDLSVRHHAGLNLFSALLFLIFAGTALAPVVRAQSISATVLGTVKDPSGKVVTQAKVTLTNRGTDTQRSELTSESGDYRFADVDAGTYVLTIELPGFAKEEFAAFDVLARETRRLDSTLRVATQSQTVDVQEAQSAEIQTDTSNVAETKTGRELVDLPVAIATRGSGSTSPISTLTTQPGVQVDSSGNISVAGAIPSQLSVSIDGISVMGPRAAENGPINELFPSFNAIEEIRISEVMNPAEFGGIADIATISKSGTNLYHGGLFENVQNTAMNASNTFTHTTPTLKMNDFGAFFGGPVSIPKLYNGRDRTFFFGSYEALRLPRQVIQIENVPSVAMRNGDLTSLGGPVIPASQISPLTLKMLQYLFPVPNYGLPGATSNNYAAYFGTPINSSQADLRLDQVISPKQQTYVRMTYKNRRVENPPSSTSSALLGPFSQPEIDYSITGGYNYVIKPTVINELRGGISGNHYATSYGITAASISSELGLTGFSIPSGDAVPDIRIAGYQGTGGTASNRGANRTIQLLDTLSWTKGSHTLKFGADYRYLNGLYTNVFASRRLGRYTFNGNVTDGYLNNGVAADWVPFDAFLQGIPDVAAIATVLQPDTHAYSGHYAFFTQDDWKVSSRLTLNIGLRYEYHPMFRDHLNNLTNFLPSYTSIVDGKTVPGAVIIPNQASFSILNPAFAESISPTPILTAAEAGLPASLRNSQKTDFAPRAGFAWKPFSGDHTVIRGGYGVFIEALMGGALDSAWGVHTSDVAGFNNPAGTSTSAAIYRFPYAFPGNLAQPGSQSFYQAFDVNYKDPIVQEWDLTLEQDLGKGYSLRASYDGNNGSHLGLLTNVNELPSNTVGFSALSSSAPYPLWNYIAYQRSIGVSNYNAGTVAVQKRFAHGFQFQGSYIYAKNLSNNAGYDPTTFTGENGGTVTDQFHPGLDYGNVSFTRRNRFLVTALYELPFGKGKMFMNAGNAVMDRVLGGWEVAGVLVSQSGPFMTILAPGDPAGNGFPALVGDGRADTVSNVSTSAGRSLNTWVNPAAFAVPADNIGRIADSAVGAVTGPGTQAVSLSLFKGGFSVTERLRVQIGASVANAFNHPNYAPPGNLTLGTSGFASVTNLQTAEGAGPRSIQLTARVTF